MPDEPVGARTLAVSIARRPEDVFGFVSDLTNLPRWSFFDSARNEEGRWLVAWGEREYEFRLLIDEAVGVVDHLILLPTGVEMRLPMRVLPNGGGTEFVFTLFQAPGMTDEAFAAEARVVREDLDRLKRILESDGGE